MQDYEEQTEDLTLVLDWNLTCADACQSFFLEYHGSQSTP